MSKLLRDMALEVAARYIGTHEVGGNNHGAQIERWLHLLGLPAGQPWCAAFIHGSYHEAAQELGVKNPLPRTGHVGRLWWQSLDTWKTQHPTRGAIFIHSKNPADVLNSPGHCGIVDRVYPDEVITIEGNTNEAGERDSLTGDAVLRKIRPIGYANVGFLDLGRVEDTAKIRIT